jgi:hypothetical protein
MKFRKRMLARTILAGLSAAGMPAALTIGAAIMAPQASAQSDYSNGSLSGTVVDQDGKPVSGASVSVQSQAQGFTRTTTTDSSGAFRVPLIPQGAYTVTVAATGLQTISAKDLRVQVGADNSYRLVLEPASSTEVIVVTGVRPQEEFSQTTTGISVDIEEFNERMPIARNITAITLLAPTAVPIDQIFAANGSAQLLAPASIGGASGGENAFFVNGLNITNFVNGLGGASVPFYFYQNVDVKTGGYQAEFGRATGGVINATTKAGGNDFEFGFHADYQPDSLREDGRDTATQQYSLFGYDERSFTAEASGPIIPDHLFFYVLGQWQTTEYESAVTTGTYTENRLGAPFYGLKLDGYITDDHHIEFTWFDSSTVRKRDVFAFNPTTNVIAGTRSSAERLQLGGENYVARYTGSFGDNLVVSAAYGRMETDQSLTTNLSGTPRVQDGRLGITPSLIDRSPQRTAAGVNPFLAEREFYRADVDYFIDFFGAHHFRGGYDKEETVLTENSVRNGGANYTYSTASATNTLGLATGQEYLQRRVFISGGGFEGSSEAFYIQDSWDATDQLNIQLGWRLDKFALADPNGTVFQEFDDEQALRLGVSYDVFGDGSAKLYGFAGRYYLPIASNTSFRIAAPAVDFTEFFRPAGGGLYFGTGPATNATATNGINPANGLPTAGLGPQITGAASLQLCPAGVPSIAAAGTRACSVRDDGTSHDLSTLTSTDLGSTYEDEYSIGYSQQINDKWSAGVSLMYRNLGRVSEDVLIDQGIFAYCARNNIAGCGNLYSGQDAYVILNPGFSANVNLPVALPGGITNITLTADDLGLPKVRREYIGLTFDFNREFDGKWGLGGSYTLSRSEGNFEGALKSDTGQTDAGIVSDFDFLSFLPGQYGLLPNHHAHQFKLMGTYAITPDFLVGMNASVISPRHYGCIGLAPGTYANGDGAVANNSYGVENARFCNGVVVDRGSRFTADWVTRIDLSFRYTLPESIMPFGELTLRADIFNVLNLDSATDGYEFGELDGGGPDADYREDTYIQTPRYFRFGMDYKF